LSGPSPIRSPAIVLGRVDYGEADRIVTLFTAEQGRLAALARGARGSRRRFGAALEPFGVLEAAFTFGRGSVATLREASCLRTFPRLIGSLPALRAAATALERTRPLLPERAPDRRVFDAFVRLFEALDEGGDEADVATAFELRILALIGLSPRLDGCARCGKPRGARAGTFAAGQGGLVCQKDGGGPLLLGARALDAMQAALGADWSAVRFGLDLASVDEAVAAFVDWHIRAGRGQHGGP
jgi:DNA repair protein RecO (recombination protein O)